MMEQAQNAADRNRGLVDQLARSNEYREYARAFHEAVGMPLSLRPVEALDRPHHDSPLENPFCALLAGTSRSCAACLQFQQQVAAGAGD